MAENNEHNSAIAWEKLLTSMDLMTDFVSILENIEADSNKESGYGYNPRSKSSTKRTHTRPKDTHLRWADKNYRDWGFRSRELFLGACVGFAISEQTAFAKYIQECTARTNTPGPLAEDNSTNSDVEDNGENGQTNPEDTDSKSDVPDDDFDNIEMSDIEDDLENEDN